MAGSFDNVRKGPGGARVGAGRKKGSTNLIRTQSLRAAFDATLGIPFEQVLANIMLKLFNDFQNDRNVDAAARYAMNIAKYLVQPVPQVIETEVTVDNMSSDEVNARLASILSSKTNEQNPPDSGDFVDQE